MLSGVAKRIITPEFELLSRLSGLQNVTFGGVLDDLYVRALYLENRGKKILFISFDLDKVPHPIEKVMLISRKFSIPIENIVIYSTHTHSAPISGKRVNEGPNIISSKPIEVQEATEIYDRVLDEKMLEAVKEALGTAQAVKIGFGFGESFINISRLETYNDYSDEQFKPFIGLGMNHKKVIDHRLFVLKIMTLDNQLLSLFINFPVHNCVMIKNKCGKDGTTLISSDLAGNTIAYLEERFPKATILWSSGAAADINPLFSNEMFYPDPVTGKPVLLEPNSGEIPLAILKMLSLRHYRDILVVSSAIQDFEDDLELGAAVDIAEIPATDDKGVEQEVPYQVRLQLIKLGDLAFLGASGELFSSLGQAIEKASRVEHMLIINHDASLATPSTGYIFDDETLDLDNRCQLPGHRGSLITKGYIKPALEKITQKLVKKVFKNK